MKAFHFPPFERYNEREREGSIEGTDWLVEVYLRVAFNRQVVRFVLHVVGKTLRYSCSRYLCAKNILHINDGCSSWPLEETAAKSVCNG